MSADLPALLTVYELAELLRMPRGTVYTLLERGQIPGARKYGRSWRIRRDAVLEAHLGESAPRVVNRGAT